MRRTTNRSTRRALRLAAGALALATATGLAGCSGDDVERDPAVVDDPSATVDDPSVAPSDGAGTGSTPVADCAALVPDPVIEALGWTPDGEAVADSDRCERRVAGSGAVTVGTRAVTPGGDAHEAALATHDELCRDQVTGQDQDLSFLPDDVPACGELLPEEGTGVAELFLVTDQDQVVQVRVEALEPVTREQLVAALGELAELAESAY